ncbi:uncharacterized protein LOC128879934 [Hylaeus volcanicus]|uniref:uncharacterized protein LOC128879934 n=1 Tax=Hylaeus volcanicus TaxID=313075 RepID=UPI0023B77707|nr:uncharacterized protein LOC128879934 [Hylaeus volcanicus]
MASKSEQILTLHQLGNRYCDIARTLGIDKSNVRRTIKRFEELGHTRRRSGSGRKRTIRTAKNRKLIRDRVNRNSRVSMRKIARECRISDRSVRRMTKEDLNLKPYKLQKVQFLTAENKRVRFQRCGRLLHRHAPLDWDRILFTDEKLFTIEQAHSR